MRQSRPPGSVRGACRKALRRNNLRRLRRTFVRLQGAQRWSIVGLCDALCNDAGGRKNQQDGQVISARRLRRVSTAIAKSADQIQLLMAQRNDKRAPDALGNFAQEDGGGISRLGGTGRWCRVRRRGELAGIARCGPSLVLVAAGSGWSADWLKSPLIPRSARPKKVRPAVARWPQVSLRHSRGRANPQRHLDGDGRRRNPFSAGTIVKRFTWSCARLLPA